MSDQLTSLQQSIATLRAEFESDAKPIDDKRQFYLGNKGKFKELTDVIRTLPADERKEAGRILNELKGWLNDQLSQLSTINYQQPTASDPTIPGIDLNLGHVHPMSQAINEITKIFERIGFIRVRYPEVDGDYYAFESLNMPADHPARDDWETFFLNLPEDGLLGKIVLTPHTSNGQVREMERLGGPPIRMINIARTYRRQADVTHTQMFHQFEGLVVDKGINIQHLKGTIDHFAREFYGPDAKSRIRPFHFQFTEPSFEVDFSCTICSGTGFVPVQGSRFKVQEKRETSTQNSSETLPLTPDIYPCRFCKSGWHEVGGAGMVHPNVLRAGGIDPDEYTGFAFGWGIERTYTLRPGLHIDDIRMLYNGDLRLLEQF